MAELATIARPYAEALFKVLGAQGAQAWLNELALVGADFAEDLSGLQDRMAFFPTEEGQGKEFPSPLAGEGQGRG